MVLREDVFIMSAVRTPIGRFGGALAGVPAVDLGIRAATAALERAGVTPDEVDEVIFGMARQAGNGPNPARQIAVGAGMGEAVPAWTVNKACGSGLKSVMLGADAIALGAASVVVAGGAESMSRVPYLLGSARWGTRLGHQELTDGMYLDGFACPLADMLMGETAERLAGIYSIGRDAQDAFALGSQHRAGAAEAAGRFADERVPVMLPPTRRGPDRLERDEHPRPQATMEGLGKLPPVFSDDGSVTAGNSSGITDGAAAAVLASAAAAARLPGAPLARIVGYTVAGVDPKIMGIGPVPAVRKLLSETGLTLDDFAAVELNEAFAAQVLACLEELPFDPARLNVNGGAIALGHPIGSTGTRILTTLAHELRRRGERYGLATLCVSGGMGIALAIERV
jgi:acetyl-CoA C-acetyltransferase